MCSVTEEDFVIPVDHKVEPLRKLNLTCKKCNMEKAMVLLQKKHSYCRNCFLTVTSHKFRSTLGKTKLMKNNEKVLCIFFGDQPSIALANLIKQGIDERTHKRIIFRSVFLYIDESSLRKGEVPYDELSEVFRMLRSSGFECYVTKLSTLYGETILKNFDDPNVDNYLLSNENDHKLSSLFHEMKNNTSKIDLLWRLRYLLYFSAAKLLQCSKIFIPECGTDLSVRLLSNVALGRGSRISSDVTVCDKRVPGIFLIRPLREITWKEIAFYNVFRQSKLSISYPVIFMRDAGSSLQEETESFIYGLQEEFPSTVYTIFHTGDKLKMSEKSSDEIICQLCFHSFKMEVSKMQSEERNICAVDEIDDTKRCSSCDCRKKLDVKIKANKLFCYACQRIIDDMNSTTNFPVAILKEMRFELHMDAMKKEIEDFLL